LGEINAGKDQGEYNRGFDEPFFSSTWRYKLPEAPQGWFWQAWPI
jgi:hypothetical protein